MFMPSYTLRIILLQSEGEEELCSTFSIKIPAFISIMHTINRNVVILGDLLFLSLDESIAADT